MTTALEITSRAIRYCRVSDGIITALGSLPLAADADPIEALTHAPLPSPLGNVTVLLQHPDMLQQTMVQPACPPDRLARIVRFEMISLVPDVQSVLSNWHLAPLPGDDMRVLVNLAKRDLVERISHAIKGHGGHLASLSIPSVGLYAAWRASDQPIASEDHVLLADMGGKHTHIALVKGGELIFTRTHKGGLDDIVDGVAKLRGIDNDEARKVIARLGKGAPDDVVNLIRSSAQGMGTSLTAVLRFASAQLKTTGFTPAAIYLSGAGGQIPGFRDSLAERCGWPVRLINPFAGTSARLDQEALDRMVALPSEWAPVVGAARSTSIPLDVMAQARAERRDYWTTHGILRVAAICAVSLLVLALVRQWHAAGVSQRASDRLGAAEQGLIPTAEKAERELLAAIANKERDRARVEFLRSQQAPGKVAHELLTAIASIISPDQQRVQISRYQLYPTNDGLRVLMNGSAEASGGRSFGAVLDSFRNDLRRRYPLITGISDLGSSIDNNRLQFQWELTLRNSRPPPSPDDSDADDAATDDDSNQGESPSPASTPATPSQGRSRVGRGG